MVTGFIPFGSKAYFDDPSIKPASGRKSVHIIDDMAEGLHFVGAVLDQAGYHTELHSSLAEFAREFRSVTTVAILLDIRLKEEDATDVLEFLLNSGSIAPIYLMSDDLDALRSAQRFAEEIGLSITGTIAKPFTGKQVLEYLDRKPDGLSLLFEHIDVSHAIAQGWIYPVFQPKLDLASGKIRSAELLSRMAHPDFGVVSPQKFIGQMNGEQNKILLMQNIAHTRRHFEFDPRRGNHFPVGVNLDASNLSHIREQLKGTAKSAPHLFRNLIFEITEEAVTNISQEQLKMLYKFNLDGGRLSIDDFGVGRSNFARLSRLPFSEIKIDSSIISGCSTSHSRRVMVKSIVGMARDLGAKVVAEGVETMEDLRYLQDVNCDEIQGYIVGRPMRIEKFERFVKEYNGRAG